MEELIFIAVIIFFSILESIARKRKARSGGTPQIPGEPETEEAEWRVPRGGRGTASRGGRARAPSYEPPSYEAPTRDTGSSYDDLEPEERVSREVLPEYARPHGTSVGGAARPGSEGMIPADIWEEIAGLARGRVRELETKPKPRPSPVSPPAPAPLPVPARDAWGKRTPKVGQAHPVHRAHAYFGTDPSERPPSTFDRLARSLSADAAAVRRQLRADGRHALRQAVMLQEVLGPPASLKPDRFSE
jgi:hypothetical protein